MDRYIHTCIHKQSHTLSYNVLHITDEWKRIGGEGGVGEGSDVVLCVILNCILKVKVVYSPINKQISWESWLITYWTYPSCSSARIPIMTYIHTGTVHTLHMHKCIYNYCTYTTPPQGWAFRCPVIVFFLFDL